jgi:hypothetical protein
VFGGHDGAHPLWVLSTKIEHRSEGGDSTHRLVSKQAVAVRTPTIGTPVYDGAAVKVARWDRRGTVRKRRYLRGDETVERAIDGPERRGGVSSVHLVAS